MQEKILVTGGAGFIGTHTVIELIQAGHQVVVVDNLVNSNRKSLEVVERITGVEIPFYEADIRDTDTLRDIFKQEEPTGVIHFAGLKAVGESTRIPLAYYDNNIAGTVSLLKVMEENNCKNIIFQFFCDSLRGSAYSAHLGRFPTFSDQPIRSYQAHARGNFDRYLQSRLRMECCLASLL